MPVPKKIGRCFAFTRKTLRSKSAKISDSTRSPPKLRIVTMFAGEKPLLSSLLENRPMQPQAAAASRMQR